MDVILIWLLLGIIILISAWLTQIDPQQVHPATRWLGECLIGGIPAVFGIGAGVFCELFASGVYVSGARLLEPEQAGRTLMYHFSQSGICAGGWLMVVRYRSRIRD